MKRAIAWAIGSAVVVSAIVAACGSDVTDTQGSGGGTGGAGMSSSHATTGNTGGSGGGTMTTTTPGTGGGDACTMACDHLQQCGAGSCDQLPPQIKPDCTTAQGQCIAACVNGASCMDLQTAVGTMMGPVVDCVVGCFGQGTGGGGQGGNGAGGGGAQTCQQCGTMNCQGPGIPCIMDNTCQSWLQCVGQCSDPTCAGQCDVMYQSAENLYQPVYACACTKCATPCAAEDPCGMHPPGP